MKILGNKSLASIIKIFLYMLLGISSLVVILGGIILIKDFDFFNSSNAMRTLVILYLSSWLASLLIYQFIGIFKSLEKNKIFDVENVQRLKISYIS